MPHSRFWNLGDKSQIICSPEQVASSIVLIWKNIANSWKKNTYVLVEKIFTNQAKSHNHAFMDHILNLKLSH